MYIHSCLPSFLNSLEHVREPQRRATVVKFLVGGRQLIFVDKSASPHPIEVNDT